MVSAERRSPFATEDGGVLATTGSLLANSLPPTWDDYSYRLWSLSQVDFYASRFARSMELIAKIQMHWAITGAASIPSATFNGEIANIFDDLCIQLEELGEPLKEQHRRSAEIASFIRNHNKFPNKKFLDELSLLVHHEMARLTFLALNGDEAEHYNEPLRGWENLADRFGCGFDICEANKCLALERYTAAVFHLMKVVEAGV